MKFFRYLVVLVLFAVFSVNGAMAQPDDPFDDPDNVVPITGIEYLLLAGGALGGYKLFKKKPDEEEKPSV